MKMIITATLVGGALLGSVLGLTACNPSEPIAEATAVATTRAASATVAAPKPAAFTLPAPTDFVIGVTELQRHCFGSAGCNVIYTITASYVGTATIPANESFRVLYTLTGSTIR